eukprot:280894_1
MTPNLYSQVILQTIFLISGVGNTILVSVLSYHGACTAVALFPLFESSLAQCFVYFLPNDNKTNDNIGNNIYQKEIKIFFISLYDILCTYVTFLALIWSGSLIYQLVYSSTLIITAIFRHFLIPQKQMTMQQWIACLIVSFGLFIVALGGQNNEKTETFSGNTILLPLFGTILHALGYVMAEILLESNNANIIINPNEMCYKMGFYSFLFVSLYITIYVLPNFNELFFDEINKKNGSLKIVIIGYFCYILTTFSHSWSYFKLIKLSGAVSTGINQSLRAVFVFIISAIFFCHLQESQCFNIFKLLSLIIVIVGVALYSHITSKITSQAKQL